MIKFVGIEIPGLHTCLVAEPPAPQRVLTYYWGLAGQTEINGGGGARDITCAIWLNSQDWTGALGYKDLLIEIQRLDTWVNEGAHGLLEQLGDVPHSYDDCTFLGFSPEPGSTPLLDEALTLHPELAEGTWWQPGTLRWSQLFAFRQPIG